MGAEELSPDEAQKLGVITSRKTPGRAFTSAQQHRPDLVAAIDSAMTAAGIEEAFEALTAAFAAEVAREVDRAAALTGHKRA